MKILEALVLLVVFALGVFEVGRLLVKGLRGLYRNTFGLPKAVNAAPAKFDAFAAPAEFGAVAAPAMRAQKKGKTPKPKSVGRYDRFSVQELTPWEDLPKYKGATGWFGFAKYSDVVEPDKHNYATVVYMDTAVKQYFYDVMAGWKGTGEHFQKMGRVKAWASILVWPIAFAILGMNLVALSVIVTLLVLLTVFYFAPAGVRAGRWSAEGARNLTPADWRDVYLEVAESQSRVDEMRRAGIGRRYVRGKHW